MKTAIVSAALLSFVLIGIARANLLYPSALTFGPAYASGPSSGFPWGGPPPSYGTPLDIVGIVSGVGAPFSDLLPAGPYELTMVYEGATCFETGMFDGPCTGGPYAAFDGGSLAIYLDTTPDADFTNPSTLRDGELVLLAQMSVAVVGDDDPGAACPWMDDLPDIRSSFTFTGGTWSSYVSGAGFLGISNGEINYPGNVPAPLQSLGYIFRVDGTVDIFGPVAVTPVTWGRVKALYR